MTIDNDAMDLNLMARQFRWNSERWFPTLHDGSVNMGPHYALCLAGEVGEVCNLIKKTLRYQGVRPHNHEIAAEIADIFTYLFLLAEEYKVDILKAVQDKQAVCEARWGHNPI